MLPRTDGVLVQPSPDGGVTEGGRQPTGADRGAEFGHTPARKRRAHVSGEFTGDGLNAHDQLWGEKPGVCRGGASPPGHPVRLRRTVFSDGPPPPRPYLTSMVILASSIPSPARRRPLPS